MNWHVCECSPGPLFPPEEVEAARRRVEAKRAIRRWLRALGIEAEVR